MSPFEQVYALIPVKLNPFHAILSVFVIAFVPHLMKGGLVRKKLAKSGKPYDLPNSRIQSVLLSDSSPEGLRIALLAGCHTNGLEAFGYFSIAILSCILMKVPRTTIEGASSVFVLIRILYTSIYLGPLNGVLRTVAWSLGIAVAVDLMLQAASKW